ncbi:hypothetical protein DMC30DRAFT_115080 [Rhodotorula diobovata]|uniref:Uncharacterized protein n=1 Tax=Rhodotorula diobovata TaxID=5288 RepID=A0A5C5G0U6_9BASI|nr:hypothetical protein DMC30DRAFT_115080 [Rhodotorula diobovata]
MSRPAPSGRGESALLLSSPSHDAGRPGPQAQFSSRLYMCLFARFDLRARLERRETPPGFVVSSSLAPRSCATRTRACDLYSALALLPASLSPALASPKHGPVGRLNAAAVLGVAGESMELEGSRASGTACSPLINALQLISLVVTGPCRGCSSTRGQSPHVTFVEASCALCVVYSLQSQPLLSSVEQRALSSRSRKDLTLLFAVPHTPSSPHSCQQKAALPARRRAPVRGGKQPRRDQVRTFDGSDMLAGRRHA